MTRSEALEYFKEELKDGKCSDTCPICNANEWAIKALEQPESRWIPCSERLPEPGEKVLVSTKFGMEVARAKDDSGNLWCTSVLVLGGDEVFAWMLLPEPYKREKTDG